MGPMGRSRSIYHWRQSFSNRPPSPRSRPAEHEISVKIVLLHYTVLFQNTFHTTTAHLSPIYGVKPIDNVWVLSASDRSVKVLGSNAREILTSYSQTYLIFTSSMINRFVPLVFIQFILKLLHISSYFVWNLTIFAQGEYIPPHLSYMKNVNNCNWRHKRWHALALC